VPRYDCEQLVSSRLSQRRRGCGIAAIVFSRESNSRMLSGHNPIASGGFRRAPSRQATRVERCPTAEPLVQDTISDR
jgi:hypothetical protein